MTKLSRRGRQSRTGRALWTAVELGGYSNLDERPVGGCKQKSDLIWFAFFNDSLWRLC